MNLSETISDNLQFLKRSRNYTRNQICLIIGINVRSWDSYIEGRARPPYEVLLDISDHFEIPVDEILRIDLSSAYSVMTAYSLKRNEEPKLTIDK